LVAPVVQSSASPGAIKAMSLMNSEIDVSGTLSSIRVPVLALNRSDDEDVRIDSMRYLAGRVPGARFAELAGVDSMAKPRASRAVTAISAAPEASSSSCARATHPTARSRSSACRDLRTRRRAPQPHRAEPHPGNVVTAPRSDMMFVVTEYGLVNLKGKSIPERAKAMISLAHPDFREDLERAARTNGLIPRSFA
jgi:hypothetical protein